MEDPEIDKIITRMRKRRRDPECRELKGWSQESQRPGQMQRSRIRIRELLDAGYRVTSGYYATSARGWHDPVIFFKSRATKSK